MHGFGRMEGEKSFEPNFHLQKSKEEVPFFGTADVEKWIFTLPLREKDLKESRKNHRHPHQKPAFIRKRLW